MAKKIGHEPGLRSECWDAGRVDLEGWIIGGRDGKAGAGWNGEQNWRWTGSSYEHGVVDQRKCDQSTRLCTL